MGKRSFLRDEEEEEEEEEERKREKRRMKTKMFAIIVGRQAGSTEVHKFTIGSSVCSFKPHCHHYSSFI